MAEDNVIVSRDRSGKIHVMLNVCPHRGMKVCAVESGNADAHRCIYRRPSRCLPTPASNERRPKSGSICRRRRASSRS
ncbi:Rieske 2Fe-2S domain-containing protein [Sphingobium fontiphilum]|uniref:Rieske 2Fe-2S domain-containing protein n=1 Tax=Sphingobium fontiphilum TaxID=944425 RepID=UPI001FEABC49|nr:Rieske 2Fe-2S domain-containing protein [Sphingobium fontiphilum]